ncbi:MAG: PAS domain S-box protein [Desulfatirhabdiaceae bacterium]
MQIKENSPESGISSAKPAIFQGSHDLFQNAPIGIFYSTPDGRLLDVNPCLARMYGYSSPSDMLSAVTDIAGQMYVDAADRQTFKHLLENRIQLTDYENRQRRRDGSIFWTSESIRAVKDDAGRILHYEGFTTDITSRKQAEEALGENQRRYRDISDRKQAREESRKRQQFLEAVLYHAPDAIVTLDPMHRVIDWNPGAVTMFGYTLDEAVGKNLDDLVARNHMLQEASGKTREVLSGNRLEAFETIRYRKDGTPVHVIASGSPIMVDNRLLGVVALYTDITVMKQNEQTLRTRAEELSALNTLGRNVNSTLSLQEIGNAGLRGMLNAVNADMAFLFLCHGERLLLKDVLPLSSRGRLGNIPEYRVGECLCGLAVTENRPLYSIDILEDSRCTWDECKRAGFRSFAALPLRSAGHLIGVIGLASDVRREFEKQSGFLETLSGQISVSLANALLFEEIRQELGERKRAEDALRFERERFRILVQQSPFGILLIEKTGRLTFANPMFTEIFGYRIDEIPNGRKCFRLAFPDRIYRKQVVSTWLGDMKAARLESTQPRVLDVVCRDKGKKNIRFIVVGLKTGGYIVVCEDITERLMLEDQLQHAQKMEAIGILAGGVAHDFNNLLQAISGYTQLLLLDKREGDPDHLKLSAIEKSVDRAAKLVHQLLLYSRKADSERRFVNLNQEIVQAVRIMARTIPRMVEIEFHPDTRLGTIKADPVQMEQILLNLGINAADAMPEGGKIVIQTQNITIDDANARSLVTITPGNYILMTVSDTGSGMDEKTLKHIFEPFFTTKGVGKGTGLGLASVYGIIKAHGGVIRCDSQPGQGTTFRIYFPAITREDTDTEMPTAAMPNVQGMETILIVDDEADIRDLASQMLQRFGYGVLTAKSGEEAIQIHASPNHDIDLTILDLGMPGMGGERCLRDLLMMKPGAKVVIASGYQDDLSMEQAMESGALGFIGKPFQLYEMLIQIRNILDNRG